MPTKTRTWPGHTGIRASLSRSGGGGIRTHGWLAPSTVFKTVHQDPQAQQDKDLRNEAPPVCHSFGHRHLSNRPGAGGCHRRLALDTRGRPRRHRGDGQGRLGYNHAEGPILSEPGGSGTSDPRSWREESREIRRETATKRQPPTRITTTGVASPWRCSSDARRGFGPAAFGPTNRGNREARQLIRETLGRLIVRTTDPALKDRARAVLAALDAADGLKAGKPADPTVAPTVRKRVREATLGGWNMERVREAVLSGLERMIATGEIRGPRHRKDRKQLASRIGRYLESETDPAKRARLEAILAGLAEADRLPATKGNPNRRVIGQPQKRRNSSGPAKCRTQRDLGMALKYRNGHYYAYTSTRRGKRVESRYLASGPMALFCVEQQLEATEERRAIRAAIRHRPRRGGRGPAVGTDRGPGVPGPPRLDRLRRGRLSPTDRPAGRGDGPGPRLPPPCPRPAGGDDA